MSKKQWFLTFFSIKRKIFKKSFLISNVILLILLSVALNIDTIIKSFGGDFEESYTIYYTDELDESTFGTFKVGMQNGIFDIENDPIILNESYELQEGDEYIVVVELNEDMTARVESNDLISPTVYAAITGTLDSIKLQLTALRLELSNEDVLALRSSVIIERIVINDEGATEIKGLIEEGLSVIIVFPLFLGLIMIIQMIGLEIFDEKSTKAMEVIMSNVDPKTHLKSKVFAANIFSIIQFTLIAIYSALGMGLRNIISRFNVPQIDIDIASYAKELIPVFGIIIVLYFITNILYSLVMAILASTANEMDDYQKIISPLMILMLIGFYVAVFSSVIEGATFTKIMAFIPFFSLMIVPGLFASGQIGIGAVVIIVGIMIIFTCLVYIIGVPIYKQSVLDYSTDSVFKRLIKNIKNSLNK